MTQSYEERKPLRDARLAAGLCRRCDEPHVIGKTLCQHHLDMQKAERTRARKKVVSEGRCMRCGQRRKLVTVRLCAACRKEVASFRARNKK